MNIEKIWQKNRLGIGLVEISNIP